MNGDFKELLKLLKSIDNNLLYLKKAVICEHLEDSREDQYFFHRCECKTCGVGLLKGEEKDK